MTIRIDPNITELPEPIPWIRKLTIHAAAKIGRVFLKGKETNSQETKPKPREFIVYPFQDHFRVVEIDERSQRLVTGEIRVREVIDENSP